MKYLFAGVTLHVLLLDTLYLFIGGKQNATLYAPDRLRHTLRHGKFP